MATVCASGARAQHGSLDVDLFEAGRFELIPKRGDRFEFDVVARHRLERRVAQSLHGYELTVAVQCPLVHIGCKKHPTRLQGSEDLAMPARIVGRIEIAKHFDGVDEVLALIGDR